MKLSLAQFFLFNALLAAQTAGVVPDWEVRDVAGKIEKHTAVVDGLLAQLKPEEWVAKGAPELYIDQVKQTRQFNSYLAIEAQALQEEPNRLTVALDTFVRLDHLQSLLQSVTEGLRRYQNPALADLLASAASQNSTTRELLKEYCRQLAGEREREWEVANREAQRCREVLSKQPPARKPAPVRP